MPFAFSFEFFFLSHYFGTWFKFVFSNFLRLSCVHMFLVFSIGARLYYQNLHIDIARNSLATLSQAVQFGIERELDELRLQRSLKLCHVARFVTETAELYICDKCKIDVLNPN